MSEASDIRGIRNIGVFFVVLTIIGLVVSIVTSVYAVIKARQAEEDGPPAPLVGSIGIPKITRKAK